jgi:hypothetical protein
MVGEARWVKRDKTSRIKIDNPVGSPFLGRRIRRFIADLQVLAPRNLCLCQGFVRIHLSTNRIHFVITVKIKAINK